MRLPVKITSSCMWVAIPVDWAILHWYDCGADRRSGGRSVRVRSRDYQIFSPMVLRRARFARESSDITFRDCRLGIFSDNFSRNSCIHVQCTTVCCNRDGCRQFMDEYQTNFKIQKRRHNQRKSWKKEILRSELKFCDVTKCHLIIFCFDERKKILNETILGN